MNQTSSVAPTLYKKIGIDQLNGILQKLGSLRTTAIEHEQIIRPILLTLEKLEDVDPGDVTSG